MVPDQVALAIRQQMADQTAPPGQAAPAVQKAPVGQVVPVGLEAQVDPEEQEVPAGLVAEVAALFAPTTSRNPASA
ncbi:hypothetical protein ASD52_36415 [Ensifer sp. Root142]|nr:hypothetical protein ASD52_36415 [Ensifer sp. Root142]